MPDVPDSLPALAAALRSGDLPLAAYLAELERRAAEREPVVRALMDEPGRFERLARQAGELEARFPEPAARPPLYGVAVGVKDIFHVEGLPTTGGSRLPPEELAGSQAESVSRLLAAGALVLGKTVSTEFAYFAPGPTRNPRDPERTPGGSSSGSAAAVGAGLCPLALGTQTIGSISRPAAFCGVVGYKPSYERVSRAGVIPLAESVDHVGAFTSDVAGAALAAAVLCSTWEPAEAADDPVMGVPAGPYLERASAVGREHFAAVCERLGKAFEVRRVAAMADFEEIETRHRALVAAEAAATHRSWYGRHGQLYHPKTAELIERGRAVTAQEREAARAGCRRLRSELAGLMDEHGLDLWLSPAAPGPAPRGLDSTGDPVMNLPWTHAGVPTLSLPAGANADGLPLGVQIAGRFGADELLMAWGQRLERALANG